MTTSNPPGDPTDPTTQQQGRTLSGSGVPTPPGGVRGVDAVDSMDSEPGAGTTTGADGQTAAREQQRKDTGQRSPAAGTEEGDDLAQTAALGATDDPAGGSIQPGGATP